MSQQHDRKAHFTILKQNTCKTKSHTGCVCSHATILDYETDPVWK